MKSILLLIASVLCVSANAEKVRRPLTGSPRNPATTYARPGVTAVQWAQQVRPLALQYIEVARRKNASIFFHAMGPALRAATITTGFSFICNRASAYTIPAMSVNICPSFLYFSQKDAALLMIHEMAHFLGSVLECSADNIQLKAARANGLSVNLGYAEACSEGGLDPLFTHFLPKPRP